MRREEQKHDDNDGDGDEDEGMLTNMGQNTSVMTHL